MNTTTLEPEPVTAVAVRDETALGEALSPEQFKTSVVTAAQAKVEAIADLTHSAYQKAATLKLAPEEVTALQADFPDEAFKPGAGGKADLIYIEHAFLRDRLNQVIGPGQWALIPRNRWAEPFRTQKGTEGSRVYVEAMLLIRGCFVTESIGEMEYYPSNASQNYADAVEGATTAALRRCCKNFCIGLQAWKKDWCEGWWSRKRAGHKTYQMPSSNPTPTPQPEPAKPMPNPKTVDEALSKQIEGMLEIVVAKPTAKGGTRWGIKVVHGPNKDTDCLWIGTFDRKLGENLDVLEGRQVIANYKENGKYNDLVSIGPA